MKQCKSGCEAVKEGVIGWGYNLPSMGRVMGEGRVGRSLRVELYDMCGMIKLNKIYL